MSGLTTLALKIPRNTEVTPEAAKTFLSALTSISAVSFLQNLLGIKPQRISLEIVSINQQIVFLVTAEEDLIPFIKTQLQSNYPLVIIEKIEDPLSSIPNLEFTSLKLAKGDYYPLATYFNFTDVDPLSSVLSVMAKAETNEVALVQFALQTIKSSWQSHGANYADMGAKNEDGTYQSRSDKSIITEKISYPGFRANVRLISNTNKMLTDLKSAFGVFNRSDGNLFSKRKFQLFTRSTSLADVVNRNVVDKQILNIVELATLWHLPNDKMKVPTIAWGTSVLSEPPENLPSAVNNDEEGKKNINFFARTMFKNQDTIFGIKDMDRHRHIWAIGKTGTGKSTLIANMAIDDFKKDRGVAVLDPHGDLSDTLLDYVPSRRINDVIYFNPADKEFPISINPLEVQTKEEAELVVSGLMAIFTKVWANVWSARMEYILRNSFLTLAEVPNSTLSDVLQIISDQSYRNKVVDKLKDQSLVHFWKNEFDKMPEKLQKEAIAPIQNKVGQFVTSPMIRRIISSPKSTVSLDDVMNKGKILIANLSQGRLGEDNSSLLGAMLVIKLQLIAMRRVDIPEEDRRDFYLYIDEFQNFATSSFIKILSEARKYHLSVILANQYMAQIPEEVQKAILGNAATEITFALGASDAEILHKEFSEVFSQGDLVNLSRFQIAIKMMINGQTSRPFLATTLPLPISKNQNKDKIIAVSRERWGRKQVVKEETPPIS